MQNSCTKTSRQSALRDLLAGAPELSRLQLKFSFVFIGASGKKYPIYMSGTLDVDASRNSAVWNSSIDSDGGLTGALNESKTLKPDRDVQLKGGSAGTSTSGSAPAALTFTSGNPELGRGLSLSVQKVIASGQPAWKAVSLSYFGYEAQIEDSLQANASGTATVQP